MSSVEKRPSTLYERCRYDDAPFPCAVHVGCYAAGFDRCQDVHTTVEEDVNGRTSTTRCHLCGDFKAAMYEPREWFGPVGKGSSS